MSENNENLMTAGAMAKALSLSDGKVKKAIKELGIEPDAKKGVCNYYSAATMAKVREALA